jgi:hypothetical protein
VHGQVGAPGAKSGAGSVVVLASMDPLTTTVLSVPNVLGLGVAVAAAAPLLAVGTSDGKVCEGWGV